MSITPRMLELARALLDEVEAEILGAAARPANDAPRARRPRELRRPAGESDELTRRRAQKFLRERGFRVGGTP